MKDVNKIKILGVGDCVLDYLFRCSQPPKGGSVRVPEYKVEGGGLTATAVVTCARLGAKGELISRLGDDDTAQEIIKELEQEGVETSRMIRIPGMRSNVSFIHVDIETGERTIFYYRDPNIDPLNGVPDSFLLDDTSALLVDDTWMPAAVKASQVAKENGIPIIADLKPCDHNLELVELVDILIAPFHFARSHMNGDIPKALSTILAMGTKLAIITAGKDGCWYSDGQNTGHVKAFDIEVVDTTGAGDVFHGAFAVAMGLGLDIESRLEFASAASALKCRKLGGRSGIPTLHETLKFLSENGSTLWSNIH
jgi:sugar/nucleoside kinase (ribokinase family)